MAQGEHIYRTQSFTGELMETLHSATDFIAMHLRYIQNVHVSWSRLDDYWLIIVHYILINEDDANSIHNPDDINGEVEQNGQEYP